MKVLVRAHAEESRIVIRCVTSSIQDILCFRIQRPEDDFPGIKGRNMSMQTTEEVICPIQHAFVYGNYDEGIVDGVGCELPLGGLVDFWDAWGIRVSVCEDEEEKSKEEGEEDWAEESSLEGREG